MASQDPGATARRHGGARTGGSASWRERLFPRQGPWWRRYWLPLAVVLAGVAVVLLVALGVVALYLTATVPPPEDLAVPGPTIVLSVDGDEIRSLHPAAETGRVELGDLPDHVPEAVLAAEDREFYEHRGFSPRGIVRAALANLTAGRVEQGASTITQQYVDLAVADSGRTFIGKMREIALAMRIEEQIDKDTILELYLNSVPLGRAAVGFEAGANTYFDKEASELDPNEAATLAGILAAPTAYDPGRNPEAADERRIYTLEGMAGEGWLEPDEADELVAAGLPEVVAGGETDWGAEAYYFDALSRQLEELVSEERDITTGLVVHTEMDEAMQTAAHETLVAHVGEQPFTGAIVSIDPGDGGVRALVGGTDFVEQQYNTAVQGRRQPGSAFKPFGLAAFLDAGHSPESTYPAPAEIEVEFEGHEDYEVANFGDADFGSQTVREATWSSTNTVFVQVAAEVGPDAVKEQAVQAGITDHEDFTADPSLVLGTREVSVVNLTEAFATFAGDGIGHEPRMITLVEDSLTGEVLYEADVESEQRLDENLAAQVTDVLRGVVESGTGTGAAIDRPAAGKTGTTDENIDAWFAGYVPQLTTTVWVGHLEPETMPDMTGGSLPATIWREYMQRATEGMEVLDFPEPDWAGLEVLEEAPEPSPSPTPTPTPEEEPTPSPSPTPDEDPTPSPSPTPTEDEDEEEPSPSPSPTPTEEDDDGDEGG